MLNLHHQSLARLLSVAAISSTMLLSASFVPGVAPVLAEEPANETTQAAQADTSAIPESNPYADLTQCVAGAWDFAAAAGHKLPWFAGNAMDWRQGAIDHGLKVVDHIDPSVVNSVAVWQPGVGGASGVGHVGWVEKVDGDRFLVKDRNWIPAADDERWVTWQDGISFIICDSPQPAAPAPVAA